MLKIFITHSLLIALFSIYFTPKNLFAKEKNNKIANSYNKKIKGYPSNYDILSPVARLTMMVNKPKEKKTEVYHATAFSISYSKNDNLSFLLTNAHFCILGQESNQDSILFAETSETFRGKLPKNINYPGKILRYKKESDLCIVAIIGKITPVKMAPREYIPKQLDSVITIGAPGGVFPVITKTNISAIVDRSKSKLGGMSPVGNPVGMISAKVYQGQSGSPVYNHGGKVIGIIFSATHTYGGFFILNKDIYDFVQ